MPLNKSRRLVGLAVAGLIATVTVPATALEVDGDVAILSDYVERGVSVSGEGVVGQAGLTLSGDSGAYGGVFVSTLSNAGGRDAETEIFGGYAIESGAYEIDFSVSYIALHGNNTTGFADLGVTVSRDFGVAYISGGLRVAPDGRRDRSVDSAVYVYTDVEVPVPTMSWATLALHVGHESLDGGRDKLDWSAGAYFYVKGIELNFTYYDTDLGPVDEANSRFVVGAKLLF